MGSYFKPLRRKFGLLTLVLACVLIVGWVRSYFIQDIFELPSAERSLSCLTSSDGIVTWITFSPIDPDATMMGLQEKVDLMTAMIAVIFENKFTGVNRSLVDVRMDTIRSIAWFMPYCLIVIPLTLLSAWLLLSKPRIAKPREKQG